MRGLPVLLLMAACLSAAGTLSGCVGCHPHLDVRLCRPESETCIPSDGDPVVDWNPDLASVFPDLARLLEEAPLGKHRHAEWSTAQEEAFWSFWDVPLDREEKQVFLRHDGGLYRVRVLSCG